MTTYRVRFSPITLKASIHSVSCRIVKTAIHETGRFDVTANTAAAAAAKVYEQEQFHERGLEFPKVCACCGE